MPNSIQYAKYKEKMKNDPDKYLKEKERINDLIKTKYHNDPEFRKKCLEYQKSYYKLKKSFTTSTTST